jgi:hypothetical protein
VVNKSILMIVNCDFYFDRGNRSFALIPVLIPIFETQVIVYAVANGSWFSLHIKGMHKSKLLKLALVRISPIASNAPRCLTLNAISSFVQSWDTII